MMKLIWDRVHVWLAANAPGITLERPSQPASECRAHGLSARRCRNRDVADHAEERGPAATLVVAPLRSPFGIVELGPGDAVERFREAPVLPHWVNAGFYVLGEEALARLPEKGDHEHTTFPELAAEGRLLAYRHEGMWLTVNTPKDLRAAEEALATGVAR